MAFVDGHVEIHTMHDWTLPVEDNAARWFPKEIVDHEREFLAANTPLADNWAPLRGWTRAIFELGLRLGL